MNSFLGFSHLLVAPVITRDFKVARLRSDCTRDVVYNLSVLLLLLSNTSEQGSFVSGAPGLAYKGKG